MFWHLDIVLHKVVLRYGVAILAAATLWWLPTAAEAVPAHPKLHADHYDPLDLVSLALSSDLDFGTPNALAESYDDLTQGRELSLGNSRRVVDLLIRSFDAKSERRFLQKFVEPEAEETPFILERFLSREPAKEPEPVNIEKGIGETGISSNISIDGEVHQSTANALRFMVNIAPGTSLSELKDGHGEDSLQPPGAANQLGGSGLDPVAGETMLKIFSPQMSASGLVSFSVLGLGEFSIVVSEQNWSLNVAGMTFNLHEVGDSSIDRPRDLLQIRPKKYEGGRNSPESVFSSSSNPDTNSLVSKLFGLVGEVLGDPMFVVIILMFSVVFIVVKIMRSVSAS